MKLQNKEDLNKYMIKCENLDEKIKVAKRLANIGISRGIFRHYNTSKPKCDCITYEYNDCYTDCNDTALALVGALALVREEASFQEFMDETKQFLPNDNKKLPDYECDHDGRVMRINNWNSSKIVYCLSEVKFLPCLLNQEQKLIEYCIDQGLCFEREEDCKAHEARKIVETKLRNIAHRLNNGKKIDWEDSDQAKYEIAYNHRGPFKWEVYEIRNQGAIFCLSEDFLKEAIEEIGEEELIKYLKGN